MEISFERRFKDEELGIRVRAILGVPEEYLTNDIISSPVFKTKAENYINRRIKSYDDDVELNENLLSIAYIYYICHEVCSGMYSRLPKQMENLSTKTILQNINWDSKALEMLDTCNEIIDNVLEEFGEDISIGNTFAVLSDASEYPNTSI